MTTPLNAIAAHLDALLGVADIPDYPNAVNGVQFTHRGPVRAVASAVDASATTIQAAARAGANLLLVHHGLFWGGLEPLVGFRHERIRLLLEHDIALYSSHLPLDAHAELGNSALLAAALQLTPTGGFAKHENIWCGVCGASDEATAALLLRARAFASTHGGDAVASVFSPERRTRKWGICSGAGAGASTLAEATLAGIDTLLVGEGPHWTAVDAPERGLVVIYAGHYATETLGVQALGEHVSRQFGLPHQFISSPTGL